MKSMVPFPSLPQRHPPGSCSTCCPAGPLDPFLTRCFPMGWPQHILVDGAVPPQVQDFTLALVELHEAPVGPFLPPVEVSGWQCGPVVSASPHSFVSSADLLRVDASPSFRSSMKMSNRTGLSTDPVLPVTGFQLNFVITLWAQPFSQFSIPLTVCSTHPHITSLSMGI